MTGQDRPWTIEAFCLWSWASAALGLAAVLTSWLVGKPLKTGRVFVYLAVAALAWAIWRGHLWARTLAVLLLAVQLSRIWIDPGAGPGRIILAVHGALVCGAALWLLGAGWHGQGTPVGEEGSPDPTPGQGRPPLRPLAVGTALALVALHFGVPLALERLGVVRPAVSGRRPRRLPAAPPAPFVRPTSWGGAVSDGTAAPALAPAPAGAAASPR